MCACGTQSLIPRPLSTEERPGTHCLHMREIFHYIFRKKLCALPCPYAEDYTNQEYRAFFELGSSNYLTCRTLLGYYFSDMAVSFFQTYSPTEREQIGLLKRAVQGSRQKYLSPLYTVCNRLRLEHDRLLQQKRRAIQPYQAANQQSLSPLFV